MFLRRLVIRGFKSFADRTVFDFTPGVSVIVGPNGSGKSNIVDAISWVLGEQGAKSLRGGSMEDVIFAGTPKRPQLGRAEVELTIDNSAGVLPIEFTEVTISRTLFRSGQSEYAINGAPCRLLDITELLSDSGIGRELHTIIGQGQLDAILNGRPEERRAVIEEAAGLLKHRKRKERAVRKLERVDADIERLGDLIGELRRQIRPLERQAELAKKAEALQAEMADVSLKLWVLDYRAVTGEEDAEAEARAQAEVVSLGERLARIVERTEQLERDLSDATRQAEQVLATEYRLAGLRDRFEALARLADERRRHLEDLAMREPRGEAPSQAEIAEAERVLAQAREGLTAAESSSRDAEGQRAQMRSAADAAARRREEIVHLHGERAALRAAVASAEEEKRTLTGRRENASRAAESAGSDRDGVRAELERLDAEETALAARVEDLESKRDAGRGVLDRMAEREREAERRAEALAARIAVLDEEIARAADPGAALTDASGVAGRVLDHVRAKPGYERALHAALGPMTEGLVALTRSDAVAALEMLKRAGARAAMVVIEGALPGEPVEDVRSVAEVVDATGPHGESIRRVLASIALADSLAEATAVAGAYPGMVVVTTDGDVIGGSSVAGGAPSETRDPHEERRAIVEELGSITDAVAALQRDAQHVRAEVEVIERELNELGERLNDLDAAVAGATERLAQLEREAHAGAREDQVLAGRLAELDERLAADTEKLKAIESRLGRAVAGSEEVDEATLAEIERTAAERALRLGEATERQRAAAATLESLRERARRIGEDRERWEAGRTGWQVAATRAAEIAASARATVERAGAWVERAHEIRTDGEATRGRLQSELDGLRGERRTVEATLTDARERAHEVDLRRAERRHRIEALVESLREHHDLAPQQALEAVRADESEREELERTHRSLDRRLGLLGRVNPVAMEQFSELVERHRFLTEQVEDLRKGRRDLLGVVEEVDRKIVEIFGAAFADIASEFATVFDRLFPGGEGRMVLSDPDDLLDSGVEIEARPPGKRVKRVSLLSGGERSLVSVAILFAVFRARPSPFYLLDEVEAALDDVNLHRFLDIAREFRETSQLLIVTHQKRTMEIADTLYGISMGGEGVSQVICEKLEDAEDAERVAAGGPSERVIELP